MKRSLIAVAFAAFAAVSYAANDQYRNQPGEQDFHQSIAASDQYRNDAGEQDQHQSIAVNDVYRNEAGSSDEHGNKVG